MLVEQQTCVQQKRQTFKLNTFNLRVPWRQQMFIDMMWQFRSPSHLPIDEHVSRLDKYIKQCANRAFGKAADRPRMPWISSTTWAIIKFIAPLRRLSFSSHAEAKRSKLAMVWLAWCGTAHAPFEPGQGYDGALVRGWHAAAKCVDMRKKWLALCRINACLWCACSRLQQLTRPMVQLDRQCFLEQRAVDAQRAAHNGDSQETFAIVRSLSGGQRSVANQPVMRKDGTLTSSDMERQERWQEHFAEVFGGTVLPMSSLQSANSDHVSSVSALKVSPTSTSKALAELGRNKGVGRDRIPAELLQAGGDAMAVKVFDAYARVAVEERWPLAWTGGRIVDIYKRKGSPSDCDMSRGILLADHLSKGFCNLMAPYINPHYNKHMPTEQFGAVSGRGTDFATHIIRSFIEMCSMNASSYFILFVDLVKAFDRVVRELVMGWPAHVSDPSEYLRSLGLTLEQAEWIAAYVARHGCLLEQWGVDRKVIALLKNLHASSWFTYGDIDSAIAVRVGGRQGCKFGATIFNSVYSIGLNMLRDALMDAGIVLRLKLKGGDVFWSSDNDESDAGDTIVLVIDAAFVDDECIMISSMSPTLLDSAINVLLSTLAKVFRLLRFEINWKPGKTECFIRYRGKGATKRLNARRVGPNNTLVVQVPDSEALITVVSQYKHLGGIVQADGCLIPDARCKAKSGLAAYMPIALKVFGSTLIFEELKLRFCASLILSRLLFNAHVVVPTARYLKIIGEVYMRVLRRVADECKFQKCLSDAGVRAKLKAASIECLLMKARLRYLGHILRSRPQALLAMLAVRVKGQALAWTKLIRSDLSVIRARVSLCSSLPEPSYGPKEWVDFITVQPERWSVAVNALFFQDSASDKLRAIFPAEVTVQYRCSQCTASFPTSKAMLAHMRSKHGIRCPQRYYSYNDGQCPVCKTCFQSRLRVLAHLSDSRQGRDKCWVCIAANPQNYVWLTEDQTKEFDNFDRKARREARQAGHTHALASMSAITAAGKLIGHVKQ
jgi:DNA-directed RNA polymerase subunit RPC12/RpoP